MSSAPSSRRVFLKQVAAVSGALAVVATGTSVPAAVHAESVNQDPTKEARMPNATSTWPDGARLAVSFSLMFEAGGQPISGAGGVIPEPIQRGSPDLPTNAFFEYGVYEGIPRLLDLFDKHRLVASSKLKRFRCFRANRPARTSAAR
jgi:hypothetical protein